MKDIHIILLKNKEKKNLSLCQTIMNLFRKEKKNSFINQNMTSDLFCKIKTIHLNTQS